jgi:hypothetical protein
MRTLKFAMPILIKGALGALIISSMIFFLSSCNKKSVLPMDDSAASSNIDLSKTTAISTMDPSLLNGTWHVSYLFDKKDKTNKFIGYSFVFNTNGTVNITGPTTLNGTWTTNTSKTKFILSLGTTKPVSELNEDYAIISQSSTQLKLTHVSGGNGGTSFLTLEK